MAGLSTGAHRKAWFRARSLVGRSETRKSCGCVILLPFCARSGCSADLIDPPFAQAYVENQTELIVHSIQALLSAIRSGASSSDLNDSLNQIVTIVSSIVAISQQALPATDAEADAVLQDLTSHCDRLNDMQNAAVYGNGNGQPVFTKQTKQAMAAASFGVAKSLKQLNGLLNAGPDSLT